MRSVSLLVYATSMVIMLWFGAFLLDWGPLKTILSGAESDLHWGVNIGTLLLFGVTHSALARPKPKDWLTRVLSERGVRTAYVAVASLSLALLMAFWVPMPQVLWSVEGQAARYGLLALHGLGWMLVVASTFQIDHAHLFGLRQAFSLSPQRAPARLAVPWLYRWVRHPMMTGFIMVLWTIPDFSLGHALIACTLTAYILLGTRWEEVDLVREMGVAYSAYQAEVPRLLPSIGGPMSSSSARVLERGSKPSIGQGRLHAHRVIELSGREPDRRDPIAIILPAMGVAARFYEQFGKALGEELEATVVLAELPGQGSDTRRASRGDDFGYECVTDIGLPMLVASLKRSHPDRPIFLVGHSLGGQLALLSLQNTAHHVTGLILIAAGAVHPRFWPRRQRLSAATMVWSVAAISRVLPWYPGRSLGFGGDQAKRWMKDWSHSAVHGNYRLHRRDRSMRTPNLRGVRTPVLSLHIHGDNVAPRSASDALLAIAPDISVRQIDVDASGLGSPWSRHFNWAKHSERISPAIVDWLQELQADGRPSAIPAREPREAFDHQYA